MFAAIARSTAEISRGAIMPPPPSLTSLQNSPVSIGLINKTWNTGDIPQANKRAILTPLIKPNRERALERAVAQ